MSHKAISQILQRAENSKSDSDFTYFIDLLLIAEAITKTVVLGMISAISDDKDRNRYRIEHTLAHADGIGEWAKAIDDVLTGPSSQYLITEAYPEQNELTKLCREGDWQYKAVTAIKQALTSLDIESEDVPAKSDMKRWFRLFSTLRNKTKGHGATRPGTVSQPAEYLRESIDTFISNFSLFKRPWAYLHRNLSGKYRVSAITEGCESLDYLKKNTTLNFVNGIYIFWNNPRLVSLLESDPELSDFYYANGSFSAKSYELISYVTDNKKSGDSKLYSTPPGILPPSETEGHGELMPKGNCLSNAPYPNIDYISRPELESELLKLLLDDRHPIITLRGRGGIGKTSLALKVLNSIYNGQHYMTVVWLSARDVDLQFTGPKAVHANVVSPEDMSKYYAKLTLSDDDIKAKGFNPLSYFEQQLQKSEVGPSLFIFDNFETTQNPLEMFTWIDTFIRLPNKALITTRLRNFKGDYPIDISGMTNNEAEELITQYANRLGIQEILTKSYKEDLFNKSEGHPYIIKILLGEVSKTKKTGSIPHIVAGSDDILTALFERTYTALTPCAQRAFMTLSAWNSLIPRLALEAVLLRSTGERHQVEAGIESLLNYSLTESHTAPTDNQEFLSLPLVASIFGKKKLIISTQKSQIQSDVDILKMLGPSRSNDLSLGLAKKLEGFIATVAKKADAVEVYKSYKPIIEMICRHYPSGWLILAQWHIETATDQSFLEAKDEINKFLESEIGGAQVAEAWRTLAFVCHRLGDVMGEMHAFVERSQLPDIPFYDVSNTANRLNQLLGKQEVTNYYQEIQALAQQMTTVLERRKTEADADDLSRMAWLAIHLNQEAQALEYVKAGLQKDPENDHCLKLAQRHGFNGN
ncbi:MAG: NB-ARC domain-containing protein [Methylococcales bacterium]|nr:NB-ARC domain-containing protein [Methylococcales bacterium]MDD5631341.1 NB-ARC domain-containing protein [Methylococcales bacterium]